MRLPALPVSSELGEIPTTLHQIWVGSKPPGWVRECWDRWDAFMVDDHPGWRLSRWTDESIAGTPFEASVRGREHYGLPARGLADLIRIQAVALMGGVYVDSDTVPLRPLHEWAGARSAWIGQGERARPKNILMNSTFGFPAGHPFLAEVWRVASGQLERGVTNEHFVAGPRIFRRVYDEGDWTGSRAVDISWDFETVEDADVMRAIRRGEPMPLETLRSRYPRCPVLHVLVNYGNWKGRFA